MPDRYAIAAATFYEELAAKLIDGARGVFEEVGHEVDVFEVPGCFELPLAAKICAQTGKYKGVACVGAVIRGETTHYDYVCNESARGIQNVQLETGVPCGFGILTVEMTHAPVFSPELVKYDPIRVVEAVTAGVAFLAAGVVIISRGEVQGLTTGAGMWLAGAIGIACGLGLWQIALFATLLTLVVLALLQLVLARVSNKASADRPAKASAPEAGN